MINRVVPSLAESAAGRGPDEQRQPANWRDNVPWLETIETFIAEHPGACLASAFVVGAVVAWWIKRR